MSPILPLMVLVICESVTHSRSGSHVRWYNCFCHLCHSFATFLHVHALLSHWLWLFLVLTTACEQLTHRMEQLLGNRSTDYYMKTIACVQAFREQSIKVNAQSRLNIQLGFTLQSILSACSFSSQGTELPFAKCVIFRLTSPLDTSGVFTVLRHSCSYQSGEGGR